MAHEQSLRYLYKSNVGRLIRPLLMNRTIAKIIGWYADCRLSAIHIPSFIKQYDINVSELKEKNVKMYRTFNDFFARKLNDHARLIDSDKNAIVSPCDGYLYIIEKISADKIFFVKNVPFTLEKFLQNKKLADYFDGGTMVIIYLAPSHYHRFHFPFDCVPNKAQQISGIYESVSEIVYKVGIQPLHTNERQIWLLRTTDNSNIGFIPVGALCVGSINSTHQPNMFYEKGVEAGYFSFGGSTIVLLFKNSFCAIDEKILEATKNNNQIDIRMGQRIAIMKEQQC